MNNKNIYLAKYVVVAVMIGLFSPSINVKSAVKTIEGYNAFPLKVSVSLLNSAEAKPGPASVNKGTKKRAKPGKKPGNRSSNKNVNVNVNKNVNVNHRHGRYGYYRGRPVLAFTVGIAIGSMVSASTMPKTCTSVVHGGVSYKRCDNTYFQPFYEGDTLVYKAVESPY